MCVFGGSSGGIRNENRSQRTISKRQTFDRVPDDIDDERFIAAWVQTALALARHYGIEGA